MERFFHYSNEGECSWYDFAQRNFNIFKIKIQLNKIRTVDYPTKAYRPPYTYLDKQKIKSQFNIQIYNWKDSLNRMLKKMI